MHSHKKIPGNDPRGSGKHHQNVFCFFLSPIQRGLSDTYLASISTTFEITGVNRCAEAYTHENFLNFCEGILQAQKLSKKQYFGWDRNHFRG